jgi:hypothetical protein
MGGSCIAVSARFRGTGRRARPGCTALQRPRQAGLFSIRSAYGDIALSILRSEGSAIKIAGQRARFLVKPSRFPDSCESLPVRPSRTRQTSLMCTLFQPGRSFPCFLAMHFPVITKPPSLLSFVCEGARMPETSAPARHQLAIFHREIRISLYFSLFFIAETGWPRTAWSASQSGLCGPVARSTKSSGISAC